jgi:hypothetical protein
VRRGDHPPDPCPSEQPVPVALPEHKMGIFRDLEFGVVTICVHHHARYRGPRSSCPLRMQLSAKRQRFLWYSQNRGPKVRIPLPPPASLSPGDSEAGGEKARLSPERAHGTGSEKGTWWRRTGVFGPYFSGRALMQYPLGIRRRCRQALAAVEPRPGLTHSLETLDRRFAPHPAAIPDITVELAPLHLYDELSTIQPVGAS